MTDYFANERRLYQLKEKMTEEAKNHIDDVRKMNLELLYHHVGFENSQQGDTLSPELIQEFYEELSEHGMPGFNYNMKKDFERRIEAACRNRNRK
jgi:hypothetical protein